MIVTIEICVSVCGIVCIQTFFEPALVMQGKGLKGVSICLSAQVSKNIQIYNSNIHVDFTVKCCLQISLLRKSELHNLSEQNSTFIGMSFLYNSDILSVQQHNCHHHSLIFPSSLVIL
jgi:hypothetical protein